LIVPCAHRHCVLTDRFTEMILQNIITQARAVIEPYQSTPASVPDPSFALQLNDEILSGSNLFAIQKTFDGAFSFDVYFESASAGHKLNG
jgi:mannosyl-oligosaccharide glucosidase